MIAALGNQFPHLGQRVLATVGHMLGDVRNLHPHDHSLLVAQIIESLRVLIMGQANGIGPHFQHDVHILFHHGFRDGTANALSVLMPGCAAQGIAAAIEQKALLRIKGKGTAAEGGANLIAAGKRCGCAIQIGVALTFPQMRIGNQHLCPRLIPLNRAAHFTDSLYGKHDRFSVVCVLGVGFQRHQRIRALHFRRHKQTAAAV